jgi:aromatic-L-amino-acid/L-tryptophan decarboxylase
MSIPKAVALGMALVGSAGTIMSGAIDPIARLAEVARANDLWFHVDGAYGALAALAEPANFDGLALADSISLDAHKWLYQPLDCSVLLYRDAEVARRTFSYSAEYVKTLSDDPIEGFAFFDQTLELSRRFRPLKVWLSLRYHGLGAFREAIGENLRQARLLAELIHAEPSLELLASVQLSAVCFRWTKADAEALNDRNEEILRRVNGRGRVWLSNANIRGAVGLRACIVNHRTTDDDARAVVDESWQRHKRLKRRSRSRRSAGRRGRTTRESRMTRPSINLISRRASDGGGLTLPRSAPPPAFQAA